MTFQQDIDSKHLNVYPVVKIVFNDGSIQYISTRKGDFLPIISDTGEPLGTCTWQPQGSDFDTPPNQEYNQTEAWCLANHPNGSWHQTEVDEPPGVQQHLNPILLNIPTISESIDIETKKYKISSVTLNISDYEVDGERFSNSLVDSGGNSIINAQIYIYYVSQSAQSVEDFVAIGHYIVRDFKQTESQVNLTCEDRSQAELHKDLPVNSLDDDVEIPDKYKGKPYPMVFGSVDKSPLVLANTTYDDDQVVTLSAYADYNEINTNFNSGTQVVGSGNINISALYILQDDFYYNVKKGSGDFVGSGGENNFEYNDNVSEIAFILTPPDEMVNDSMKNRLKLFVIRKPISYNVNIIESTVNTETTALWGNLEGNTTDEINHGSQSYILDEASNRSVHLYGIFDAFSSYGGGDFSLSYITLNLEGMPSIDVSKDKDTGLPVGENKTFVFAKANEIGVPGTDSNGNPVTVNTEQAVRWAYWVDNDSNQITMPTAGTDGVYNGVFRFFNSAHNSLEGGTDSGQELTEWSDPSRYNYIKFGIPKHGVSSSPGDDDVSIFVSNRFYYLFVAHQIVVDGLVDKNFFANVSGRVSSNPKTLEVVENILTEELNFGSGNINLPNSPINNWDLSFTVDKTINSKKLIEEILQSSPYYGYFKDNKFNLYTQPNTEYLTTKQIKASDVIDYSYDRTPIEKVTTRVNVKYHYDYGLKDYTKETGFDSSTASSVIEGYNNGYYGIDNDQDLVFESKYIREHDSASLLANYLLHQFCNQHNIFTVKLPLSYVEYKLTDVVKFDRLVDGRKAFGEDYTQDVNIRNGQFVYSSFLVVGTKKTLDYVELKLYQLHNLGDAITVGCTDGNATNYDSNATLDDGSCTYPATTGFCALPLPAGITAAIDGVDWTEETCNAANGYFNVEHSQLIGLYGCMDEYADYIDEQAVFHDQNACQFTPTLGEFSFSGETISIWDYFYTYSEITGGGQQITISWGMPDNADAGLDQVTYQISFYVSTDFTQTAFYHSSVNNDSFTTTSYTTNVDALLSMALNELGINIVEYDTAYPIYIRVKCVNDHTEPQEMYCTGGYGDYHLIHITITEDEEEEEDNGYPDLEIYTPGIDLLAAYAVTDISYTEITETQQFSFTFSVYSNSPDIVLDEELSYVQLKIRWLIPVGASGTSVNNYVSVMCKIRHLSSEEEGDGVYKLKFISDQVYFTIWQDRGGSSHSYYPQLFAGDISSYNTIIGYNVSNTNNILIQPDDKLYYNIYRYAEDANETLIGNWSLADTSAYEYNGFARYILITDLYIKDITTGSAWRFDNTSSPHDPYFGSRIYANIGSEIPGDTDPTITSYDVNLSGDINVTDIDIIIFVELKLEEIYPEHDLLTPIDITDPLLDTIGTMAGADESVISNVLAMYDMNGKAPAGQFCKQDADDIYQIILAIVLQ